MSLYVVRHEHEPARCPAGDPDLGAMLLNHLSRPNVRRHGVEIMGEAVIDAEHSLYMIVEAPARHLVDEFVKPFAMVGTVNVYPASTCVRVVEVLASSCSQYAWLRASIGRLSTSRYSACRKRTVSPWPRIQK